MSARVERASRSRAQGSSSSRSRTALPAATVNSQDTAARKRRGEGAVRNVLGPNFARTYGQAREGFRESHQATVSPQVTSTARARRCRREACGRPVVDARWVRVPLKVYCSRRCAALAAAARQRARARLSQPPATCATCRGTVPVSSRRGRPRRFCSETCHRAFRPGHERACAQCGVTFRPARGEGPGRFCSNECSYASRRLDPIACAECGVTFAPEYRRQRFHSLACAHAAQRVSSRSWRRTAKGQFARGSRGRSRQVGRIRAGRAA